MTPLIQFDSDWWCFGNACCGDTDLVDVALDISIDNDPYLLRDPEEIVFGTIEIFASSDIIEELSIVRTSEPKWKMVDIQWSEDPQNECQQDIYNFIDHGDDIVNCGNGSEWLFDGDAYIEKADGFELVLGFDADVMCLGADCCAEINYFVHDESNDEDIIDEVLVCGATPAQIANAVFDLFSMEHPGVPEDIVEGQNPMESMAKTRAQRKRHHLDRKAQSSGKMHIPPPQVPEASKHGKAHPNDIILGTYDFEVRCWC